MPDTRTKQLQLFDQTEVNYTPVSVKKGAACSACRFFCEDHCHIVYGEIAPNGYCDRYETVPPPPPPPEVAPIPVMIVEPPEMTMEMATDTPQTDALISRVVERVKAWLKPEPDGAFTVQKDLNGAWRWVATFTNNFMDRDHEIISDKALDKYLARLDMHLVPMPELWAAHVEGTKHGTADMVFSVGKFLIATGAFDTTPQAQKAIEYYRKSAAKVQLSHGFTFPKWALKDGVYQDINTFEITTLPPPLVGSNPYTDLEVNQSMKQITSDQQAALSQLFGKEYVDQLVATREAQSKELVEAGVAFKDFADVTEATTPATEPPAEEAATPAPAIAPAMAELLTQILEGQGELLSRLDASGKAYTALKAQADADKAAAETRTKALEADVAKLQSELRLSPRAASIATETKLTEKESEEVRKQQAAAEADPFFS